jgi:hypothetical protein
VTGSDDAWRVHDGGPDEEHGGEQMSGQTRTDTGGNGERCADERRPTRLAKKKRPGIHAGMKVAMKNAYLKCKRLRGMG